MPVIAVLLLFLGVGIGTAVGATLVERRLRARRPCRQATAGSTDERT